MNDTTPFVHQHRVPYVWTDAQRRVFYGNYFLLADEARYAYWEHGLELGAEWVRTIEHAFFLVHIECDFHGAAEFYDLLDTNVEPHDLGRSSLGLRYRVGKADSGELLFTASTVIVWADQDSGRPAPWPETVRAALLARHGEAILKSA